MTRTVEDLQRMAEDAWDNAPLGAFTYREELRRNEFYVGGMFGIGQLSSLTKNGASQAYAFGNYTLPAPEIARGWRDLINSFDSCQQILTNAGASITDEAVYAEMKSRLWAIDSMQTDLTTLRAW